MASRFAWAQAYPLRPVRCVARYPPGGGTDIFVRLVGQPLSLRLGQPLIVENRSGAASNIATELVVRAPADGYTLLGVDSAAAINATLYPKLNFNFVRDIAVAMTRGPLVTAVHLSVPAKTVPEFLAYAKGTPGKISFGSAGYWQYHSYGRRAVQAYRGGAASNNCSARGASTSDVCCRPSLGRAYSGR
jgi:tripartite-type tricarboxylate transporter receptor subunit TctC